MIWLLFLHLCALITWSAALLILPVLIPRSVSELASCGPDGTDIARLWFTHLASPVALLAIGSGTVIFIVSRQIDAWLLVKLTLVTLLVVCHVLSGLLILYSKRGHATGVVLKCRLLLCIILSLECSIIALVLFKPSEEQLLWFL